MIAQRSAHRPARPQRPGKARTGRPFSVPLRQFPTLPMQSRSRGHGFERLPVEPFATAIVFLACAQGFGSGIVVLELLSLAAILTVRWREAMNVLVDCAPFLALPFVALLSAFWSELPLVSLRYGIQLVLTAIMGIVIARCVAPPRLPLVIFIGTASATIIGVILGRTGPSPDGPVLIGLAGSKNQMGYITLFWSTAAIAILCDGKKMLKLRFLAGVSLLPALGLLVNSESVTALVLSVLVAALAAVLIMLGQLPRTGRIVALICAFLMFPVALAAAPQIATFSERFRTDTLGKDDSLTGRTELWDAANALIAQQPVLGHGYRAVWLGPAGEGLLARFGLRDGRTFNFHNTVVEMRVDLGIAGVAALFATLLAAWLRLLVLLFKGVDAALLFAALALFGLCARMLTELVIAPFLLDTIVLFALLGLVWRPGMPLRRSRSVPATFTNGRTIKP